MAPPRPDPVVVGPGPTWRRRLAESTAVLLAVVAVLAAGWVVLRPRLLDIGSTAAERAATMPADQVVPSPRTVMTRSVTLPVPPAEVWPWLVQMGVGKGGFYGYDWLENLGPAGLVDDIVNADRVHPEWQRLRIGDHVVPLPGATSWTVTALVPRRLLVIADDNDWTWALVLKPVGADRTRLVTRMRWAPTAGAAGAVGSLVFDLGDQVVQARALAGLRQRVDGTLPGMPGVATGAPAPTARLPLGWVPALGGVAVLALLGAAAGRHLVTRRGGQLVLLTLVTVLGWCLWTDTDPWRALGHRWPAALGAAGLVAANVLLASAAPDVLPAGGDIRLKLRAFVPALCVVGIAVVLPALTVWDAATAARLTESAAGRVLGVALAAALATVAALPAWWGAQSRPQAWGVAGACLVAAVVLVTGSVLAGALLGAAAVVSLLRRPGPETGRAPVPGRSALAAAAPVAVSTSHR